MIHAAQAVYVCVMDGMDKRTSDERLLDVVASYEQKMGLKATDPRNLRVCRPKKGKPYFPDCPERHFSVSHSGSYWTCAIAECEVGLDLQEHVMLKNETEEEAAQRFLKMARRFFHPEEALFVERNRYQNFFAVWSAREAYVKYTGQGIDASFSEHCVVPKREQWECMEGSADESSWVAQGVCFWNRAYDTRYTMCVCTGDERPVIVETI